MGLYLAACIALAERIIHPQSDNPQPPDEVQVKSLGGVECWMLEPKGDPTSRTQETTFVFVHGLKGNRSQWLKAMHDVAEQGYSSVALPLPGHSGSSFSMTTIGPRESEVAMTVCRSIRKRSPRCRIVLVGVSLGGAACWLAVEKDPTLADAVLTESAFASLPEAVDYWFGRVVPNGSFWLRPAIWWASFRTGTSIGDIQPIRGAKSWRGRPAIICHVVNDRVVAESNGDKLAKAADIPLWRIEGASHSEGYNAARSEYLQHLLTLGNPTNLAINTKP